MKIMTAKYRGRCCTCGVAISAGDAIAYGGKNNVHHASCVQESAQGDDEREEGDGRDWPPSAAVLRADQRSGVMVSRFSSGAVITRNRRGRCEDAPCCGCCS